MLESLALFAVTELVLSLSPGPAVILVVSQALRHGASAGLAVALGVVAINVVYFILSLIGVGAALAASPALFAVLKYAGGAYLVWIALGIVRDVLLSSPSPSLAMASPSGPSGVSPARQKRSAFVSGALTQAASIKNIMIFLAIIPQFVDPARDAATQFVALCIISIAVELPVLAAYAMLAARLSASIRNPAWRNGLDLASATMLIAIAGLLVAGSGIG